MREVLHDLMAVRRRDGAAAMATVVRTWRSAPRPAGASMLVTDEAEAVGSVSGGCVEGAVVQEALAMLATGRPKLLTYGIADELAQSVGLACGGVIEVFVEPI